MTETNPAPTQKKEDAESSAPEQDVTENPDEVLWGYQIERDTYNTRDNPSQHREPASA